jgi:hypothetical protein
VRLRSKAAAMPWIVDGIGPPLTQRHDLGLMQPGPAARQLLTPINDVNRCTQCLQAIPVM